MIQKRNIGRFKPHIYRPMRWAQMFHMYFFQSQYFCRNLKTRLFLRQFSLSAVIKWGSVGSLNCWSVSALFGKCHESIVLTCCCKNKMLLTGLLLKKIIGLTRFTAPVWARHLVFAGLGPLAERFTSKGGLGWEEKREWIDSRDKEEGREDMKACATMSASSRPISLTGAQWKGGHVPRLLN